ncbi:glycosyltransferase family 4 protein [Bacillus infantis]|uniref:glycosyltransferase family 4 protein n=1 Tax=Bacillus infantis TaxID=324767 RepID=UPI0021554347|nr:glycosyltransferase family 4 protein [Bacillus infantis]MCR6610853.1 glycosyltransferase family 4 protein [Bacillus infantis]
MKVIMASPNFHQERGNTITVKRISEGLRRLGTDTVIVSSTEIPASPLPEGDIVHGFHAYRFFLYKEMLDVPIDCYIITMTGTDLNQDLFEHERRQAVIRTLREAKAVTVFNEQAKQLLIREVPDAAAKVYVIPQGRSLFEPMEPVFKKEEDTFVFLLPAGIRKIKNIPFAIRSLKKLHDRYPRIRLVISGPVLEEEEGSYVKKLAEQEDWVSYTGQISHSRMGSLYECADALLNTSISEGQPAAIIEAMDYGLPVLVSANEGNISIVKDGITGFVYHNEDEFLAYAERLINNYEIRKKLGAAAKNYIAEHHSNVSEAESLLRIYSRVLAPS